MLSSIRLARTLKILKTQTNILNIEDLNNRIKNQDLYLYKLTNVELLIVNINTQVKNN